MSTLVPTAGLQRSRNERWRSPAANSDESSARRRSMNEAKLQDFMGKLVNDMGGAAMLANMILGDELGLYRAMADGQPMTPEELAGKTGCNARLLREWLSAHAAAGYVEHPDGSFRLPEEQAMALAKEDSPVYVAGGASVVATLLPRQGQAGPRHARRRRAGLGRPPPVPVQRHRAVLPAGLPRASGGRMAAGAGRRRRQAEAGAKVADIGCGHGASTVIMAQAFPASRFIGFDYHGCRSRRPTAGRRGRRRRRPRCVCRRPSAKDFEGTRLRPDLLLRLPARHG